MITGEVQALRDNQGREWVWDPGLHSWRHDDGARTLLRDLPDLEAQAGPLTERPGTHREVEPADTQPMPVVGDTALPAGCSVCGDNGTAPCHCRPPGWVLPEHVPAAVHGREEARAHG
ncbi:MAG: hypothetical protein LC749_02370 [Actinobacteria bacterium]|nr:hypothetical protein [Actinomycetota bacterium]